MSRLSRHRRAKKVPLPLSGAHAQTAHQAERDYYDCMARFGCDSAEAHVAGIVWRRLRSNEAGGPAGSH